MSVDKFGRSNASIVRRSIHRTPSRKILQSVGVLCKTGAYVDFNRAFARNIGKPVELFDAATKEYVDESARIAQLTVEKLKEQVNESVKKIPEVAEKIVLDNLDRVINSTYELTTGYVDNQMKSLTPGFKLLIDQSVVKSRKADDRNLIEQMQKENRELITKELESFNAANKVQLVKEVQQQLKEELKPIDKSLDATNTALMRYHKAAQQDTEVAIQHASKATGQTVLLEETITKLTNRINVLEQKAGIRKQPQQPQQASRAKPPVKPPVKLPARPPVKSPAKAPVKPTAKAPGRH